MRTSKFDLDDIGFIGGGPAPSEDEFRAISAFIKARKAKLAATRKAVAKRTVKRVPAKRGSRKKG